MDTETTRRAFHWTGRRLTAPRVASASLTLLGLLTLSEVSTRLATGADSGVLSWMLAHRSGLLTSAALAVTHSGTSPLLFPMVALAGLVVWWRTRHWLPAVAATGVAVAGVLSRLALSRLVGDARPPRVDWLAPAQGFSFPSGHATTSALIAGTIAWLLTFVVPHWARVTIGLVLGAWALLVGLSRIYLGVHWITDVLGGWLLAGAWLSVLVSITSSRAWSARGGKGIATPATKPMPG